MPALLMRMSRELTVPAASWICAALVTSRVSGVTRPSGWVRGTRVPAYTRSASLLSASSASAWPMPRLAPVTRIVLPVMIMPVPSVVVGDHDASRLRPGTHALLALPLLQHLEDVSGRVLEPGGDERPTAPGDAPLVLVHPVVSLELDAVLGQLAGRGLDVVHLEHEDGVGGRGVVRFQVHPGVAAARQVQGEQSVLLGNPDPECLAVELPGLSQVVDGERAECFRVREHGVLVSFEPVSVNLRCSSPAAVPCSLP